MKCFSSLGLLISIFQAVRCLSDNQAMQLVPRDNLKGFLKETDGHSFPYHHHTANARLFARDESSNTVGIFPRGGKPHDQRRNSNGASSVAVQPPNQAVRPFTWKAPTSSRSGVEPGRAISRPGGKIADLMSEHEVETGKQPAREAGRKRPSPRNALQELANDARPGRSSSPESPGTPGTETSDSREQLIQHKPSPLRRSSRSNSPVRKLHKSNSFRKGLNKAGELSQGSMDLTSMLDPLFKSPIRKVRPGGGVSLESDLSEKLKQTHIFSKQDTSPFHTPNRKIQPGTQSAGSDHSARLQTIEETPPKEYTPWQSPDGSNPFETPMASRKLLSRAL